MTDSAMQQEWNTLRLDLLQDVAAADHIQSQVWDEFLEALTTAFDYQVPQYPIYRLLRTFAIVRWPLLRPMCQTEQIVRDATRMLRDCSELKGKLDTDLLESEMEVLRKLMSEDLENKN